MWVVITFIGLLFAVSPVTHNEKGCMAAILYILGAIFIVLGILIGKGIVE